MLHSPCSGVWKLGEHVWLPQKKWINDEGKLIWFMFLTIGVNQGATNICPTITDVTDDEQKKTALKMSTVRKKTIRREQSIRYSNSVCWLVATGKVNCLHTSNGKQRFWWAARGWSIVIWLSEDERISVQIHSPVSSMLFSLVMNIRMILIRMRLFDV